MSVPILSLHHVTATVDAAQDDLDFFRGLLGLRLVKKTVNFDNHHVYHFYYGDERGRPGTLFTTFPYRGHGVPFGRHGAGQVAATAFSVASGTLPRWRERLEGHGARVVADGERYAAPFLLVVDPSGLAVELVEAGEDAREPWVTPEVDRTMAIRGLHSVTLLVRAATPTIRFLVDQLGYRVVAEDGDRTRLGVGTCQAGECVDVIHAPREAPGVNGLGTVHHVAMAIATEEEQLAARDALMMAGAGVTPVRDRQYFRSIYFREPGGVLYEIATLAPGFAVDEELSMLGQGLKLPPWEEPNRRDIEQGLPPIHS
ncbi:MAG: ring-cleaving dioxygenase [Gemmatimonadaceae bacterium]